MATNPIRWDNIEPSNYAGIAAAMAAGRRGISDGIQGIADQFTQMKDDRISLATQEAKAQLLGLTDRGSYAQDSAGIIGGLDRGNVNLDDVLKFQQNREKHLLDTAIDRFKADHMQQRFDMDMQGKQSRINRNNRVRTGQAGTDKTQNRELADTATSLIQEYGMDKARQMWLASSNDPRVFGKALKSYQSTFGAKPQGTGYKSGKLDDDYGESLEDRTENMFGLGGFSAEDVNALDAKFPGLSIQDKQQIFNQAHTDEIYDISKIEQLMTEKQAEVWSAQEAQRRRLDIWNKRTQ